MQYRFCDYVGNMTVNMVEYCYIHTLTWTFLLIDARSFLTLRVQYIVKRRSTLTPSAGAPRHMEGATLVPYRRSRAPKQHITRTTQYR